MENLIEDLLHLSRVSRIDLNSSEVDLSREAGQVMDEITQADPYRRVDFICAPGLKGQADPGLIRIVLTNLLGNAWKYTSQHETARIEFGKTELRGKTCFFVRDDGAWFNMEYARKLFAPFQRLHSLREFEGNGIGLAIIQRIIKRHGGDVWAESFVEKGATFYFTLPRI
ncbi:hypothetical protein A2212_00855 [candidate division WWE3 bacterium RIFOXYA1_FULL_42_9]|nr:MAG: hypothetical protein A2212_00855 [candidate division WWE3 bacterium RIFOXYA1_FULL_42_9]